MRFRTALVAALATALLAPGAALAQDPPPSYPEPKDPGKVVPAPKGKGKTRTVCKRGCTFKKIQAAVNKSKKGDTVRIKNGTYREAVKVTGPKKSYLKLIGNAKNPGKVVLEGSDDKQNGIFVNGADEVTVRGIKAQDYTANGFFFVNVVGYTVRDLIAAKTGVYGIYAFNSKGGTMRDSEAYYNNDAGFYIGQTPAQVKPIRSIVDNIDSWGNPLGWSGTNMRYVTITNSRFYNNAAGLVPNALDSEKFPPAEDNIIRGNEIFWNNFDFHKGAPFKIREEGTAALVPVGTGVLLLAGRRNIVEQNKIYGNWGIGVAAIEGILLQENPQAIDLVGNDVRGNAFGLDGTDLNGRELAYDGNGTDNCFAGNTGVSVTIPADGATLAACPFAGANPFSPATQGRDAGADRRGERGGLDPPPARAEGRVRAAGALQAVTGRRIIPAACAAAVALLCAAPAGAGGPKPKRVEVADNYYLPDKLTIKQGAKVEWVWPDDVAIDVHDVKLKQRPKGVKKFQSEPASSGYEYKRTFKKPGTYEIICTLHEEMVMTIKVKRSS